MWLAHILMLLALFVAVGMIGGAENALRPESRRHTIVRLSTVIVLFVAIEGLMIWMANSTEKRGSGFLQFDRIDILQEYSWIVPGKRWGGNVYGLNPSSERIQNVVGSSWGFVEKVDDQADHRIKILADKQIMPLHKLYLTGKIKGKPEVGAGKELWGSVFTPPLTQDDADGINNGTVTIYFVSWWGWTDLQGHKDLGYDCRSLQVPLPTPYSKKDIIWHYCSQE